MAGSNETYSTRASASPSASTGTGDSRHSKSLSFTMPEGRARNTH
jgi:hypothetical protein